MLSFGDRRWLDGGFGNAVSGAGYGAGWDGNSRTSKSSSTQGPLPSSRVHTVGGSNLRISDHDDRVFRDPERHSSKQSDDGDDSIADGDFSKEILYSLNGVSILLGVIMIIFAGWESEIPFLSNLPHIGSFSNILIGVSAAIVALSFVGLIGAYCKFRAPLLCYLATLCIITIPLFSVSLLCLTYKRQLLDYIEVHWSDIRKTIPVDFCSKLQWISGDGSGSECQDKLKEELKSHLRLLAIIGITLSAFLCLGMYASSRLLKTRRVIGPLFKIANIMTFIMCLILGATGYFAGMFGLGVGWLILVLASVTALLTVVGCVMPTHEGAHNSAMSIGYLVVVLILSLSIFAASGLSFTSLEDSDTWVSDSWSNDDHPSDPIRGDQRIIDLCGCTCTTIPAISVSPESSSGQSGNVVCTSKPECITCATKERKRMKSQLAKSHYETMGTIGIVLGLDLLFITACAWDVYKRVSSDPVESASNVRGFLSVPTVRMAMS